MHDEIKNRWIENLESGEYPKGKYVLLDSEGGFCCLGVLADMYRQDNGDEWVWQAGAFMLSGTTQDNDSLLPPEVREWAGIKDEDRFVHSIGPRNSLARINDESDTFEPVIERIKEL